MGVSLRIVKGTHEGRQFDIRGESRATIGRAPEATISIDDSLLSRFHCQLDFTKEAVTLTDLRSTNGTFINKERVGSRDMGPADFFQAGGNLFQVISTPPRLETSEGTFLCPRCREEVPVEDDGAAGEVICPHCARPTNVGREVLGDYHLLEVIGRGSSGLVYKARDLREDRLVALKAIRLEGKLDSKTVSRYFRVSHTEGKLFHPHIVQVFRAAKVDGHFAISMEYVDGITLYQKICEDESLGVKNALGIALQVASALVHASSKGIVHRDVKPENILITPGNLAKLMDFSIAKRMEQESEIQVTLAGEGLGTLYYVPPEQIYNAANVDARADVYALGCTLYHMVTGWPPFKEHRGGGKKQGVLIRILSGEFIPVTEYAPHVSKDVVEVISRAMAREIDDRYGSPVEFLDDLKTAFESA